MVHKKKRLPVDLLSEEVPVKGRPELRHILAHLYMAIECTIRDCPNGALDHLKSIEGLIFFDGDDPQDYEDWYRQQQKRLSKKKRNGRKKKSRK